MKKSAIIRIVIYSIVIFLLVNVLLGGIGYGMFGLRMGHGRQDIAVETIIPLPAENPAAPAEPAPADVGDPPAFTEKTDPEPTVDSAPATEAGAESIAASTPAPTAGAGTEATVIDSANVNSISIEWVAGSINILPTDGSQIQIFESGDTEKYTMSVSLKNRELDIAFCKPRITVGINSSVSKDLTVLVPRDWYCQDLELDVAASTVNIQDLRATEVDFDGASGLCSFTNCTVDSMEIDSAAGQIHYSGTLKALDMDAASASFVGVLSSAPRGIEMDAASGTLDLTLPQDAGFTLVMEGMSKDFTTDFPISCDSGHHGQDHSHGGCNGKVHVHGNGACRIQVEGMSCDVIIRKG